MRVGIMGFPGSGKTTAALTFPNPIVLSYDSKEPKGCDIIPFYNSEFEKEMSNGLPLRYSGVRGALLKWLHEEAPKAPQGTTFILDSWTHMMNALDIWHNKMANILFASKRTKEVDTFEIHADRLLFAQEVMKEIKSLPYTFVITFHEQVERDENGRPTGMLKPLMKGQFSDQIASYMSVFIRQTIYNGTYVWEVVSTGNFHSILPPEFKKVDLINGKYIPANYNELIKRL